MAEGLRHDGLTVFVRDLRVEAGIGVHAHEQGRLQTLVLDVALELAPGPVEALADTLNYEVVARLARELAAEGHVGLVETFAQRLGTRLMDDPLVRALSVRVGKPGCLADAAEAGCEIRLSRG
ncbi:dihydroneopterin aldolase [Brevundimonas sp. A19_0]|uniref:dihydroneopterin aldolase n=1 Tax=Brevundimonas sp. A19_0 TaxID=2821087 RepID=UPI001AD9F00A|nr:dihydroneopterin aldolase [Brevundimonas sp. A19_0]MBO9500914.1 dihydroneopterin aldolase [Brevundimonas sp. A19_0]